MKALLIRTGSVPVQQHSLLPGSPRVSMQWESNRRRDLAPTIGIRRAFSESHAIRSETDVSTGLSRLSGVGSRSSPALIPEDYASEALDDRWRFTGIGIPVEEIEFSGGGHGGSDSVSSNFTGGGGGESDRIKVGAYYQEMLRSNPTDSLLLRNYGKFLHEVERDLIKAEEYYGRAILASPGDGEVLSLYGRLIWESHRDEDRAKSYFDLAVNASPDDCTVLGSYAKFIWDADEEDEEEECDGGLNGGTSHQLSASAVVEAF